MQITSQRHLPFQCLERFSIDCHKTKTKVITANLILTNVNITAESQWELEVNTYKRSWARENASDQVGIGFSLSFLVKLLWLVEWVARVFQTNHTQLKIVLNVRSSSLSLEIQWSWLSVKFNSDGEGYCQGKKYEVWQSLLSFSTVFL